MITELFKPLNIGNVTIKNRLVVSAMVMDICNPDGTLTDRFIRYHEEKAKGGWGLNALFEARAEWDEASLGTLLLSYRLFLLRPVLPVPIPTDSALPYRLSGLLLSMSSS